MINMYMPQFYSIVMVIWTYYIEKMTIAKWPPMLPRFNFSLNPITKGTPHPLQV